MRGADGLKYGVVPAWLPWTWRAGAARPERSLPGVGATELTHHAVVAASSPERSASRDRSRRLEARERARIVIEPLTSLVSTTCSVHSRGSSEVIEVRAVFGVEHVEMDGRRR